MQLKTLGTGLMSLVLALYLATAASAENDSNVLIIYDSSNSMWGELADGSRKYEAGRSALASILDQGFGGRQVGFRAYGHRSPDDCRDSQLIAPFGPEAAKSSAILEAANANRPTGKTPITYSLIEGLKDFGDGAGDILLVSDGLETCDADPCALVAEWKDRDVDVRVHVVGVGLDAIERQAMSCIAETSGGTYFDADSASGFVTALQEAGDAIEAADAGAPLQAGDPDPDPDGIGFAIIYRAFDASGRQYSDAEGRLFLDGAVVDEQTVAQGRGRNTVDGPGQYELEVGVLLKDGTLYEPRRVPVEVTGPGDTLIDVTLAAPARVSAVFTENGAPHPGALVAAFQDGAEVFKFRAQDVAFARPGTYEFRATVNDDNQVEATAALVADQETTVAFELLETVQVFVEFELPDGTILSRLSTLWKDGEEVYSLNGRNGAEVKPGTYEVRSDDQNLPLTPRDLVIGPQNNKTYRIDMPAGWVTINYADEPENYFKEKVPRRAQLHSVDRGGWQFSAPGMVAPVAPGDYLVQGFEKDGVFAPIAITVKSGDAVEATLTPAPLGALVMTYAPSDNYLANPDRASVAALDGQPLPVSFMRPGKPLKLAPGRYRVDGRSNAGDIPSVEVSITAGAVAEVTLKLAGE